ncbi:MAG: D-alanyl-D-alanine carboxypeptidase [Geminicoccaceae bacterium]|nr:MAG: D-alanyl-D-alanine carboxypeptidase [Geminicoccaceae bacterium]
MCGGDAVPRFWTGVLALVVLVGLAAMTPAEARRYASIVIDARTGEVLHEAHADRWVYPASLTKMMTLYMTFEALEQGRLTMGQMLPVSAEAASRPPSRLGLRAGQRISVEDVIYALVTRSANDAAVVIAEALGGSEAQFARMMTERARGLGLRATTFRNASGLPNDAQRTTARDMALLGQRLQRDFPQHYHVFSTRRFVFQGTEHGNHNRLLASYTGTDGIKTGFIRASGFNVVTSTQRNGRRLIGVVIGGQTAASRNAHMTRLLDAAFARAGRGPTIMAVAPSPRRPTTADAPVLQVAASSPIAVNTPVVDTPAAAATMAMAASPLAELTPRLRPAPADTETVQLVTAATAGRAASAAAPGQITPLRVVITPEPHEEEGSAETVESDPPLPATVLAERVIEDGMRTFGVQVGAFDTAVAAHRAAESVLQHLPQALAGSQIEVSAVEQNGRTLFRARRMGIAEPNAQAACRQLLDRGQACFVLKRSGLETRVVAQPSPT